jgi:hypothetical protein
MTPLARSFTADRDRVHRPAICIAWPRPTIAIPPEVSGA